MTSPHGATGTGSRRWPGVWIAGVLLGLLLLGAIGYLWLSSHPIIAEYRQLAQFYASKRAVGAYVRSFGAYAPAVFVALQALQVVVAPIPGEATGILGGYLFGTGIGFLYSTLGLTLGSALAFLLARWLGLPVVRRVVSTEIYHKFDVVARAGGELVTLVCFLLPGFPKDYLCFLLGLSPLPFRTFLLLSTLGRLPGTWLLSLQGATVRRGQYGTLAVCLVIAALACGAAYLYREALYAWVRRRTSAGPTRDPDAGRP